MVQVLLHRAHLLILPAARAVAARGPLPFLLEVALFDLRATAFNVVGAAEVLLHTLHGVLAAAQGLGHVDRRADGLREHAALAQAMERRGDQGDGARPPAAVADRRGRRLNFPARRTFAVAVLPQGCSAVAAGAGP